MAAASVFCWAAIVAALGVFSLSGSGVFDGDFEGVGVLFEDGVCDGLGFHQPPPPTGWLPPEPPTP